MTPIENQPPTVAGADFDPTAPRSDMRNPETWAKAFVLLETLGQRLPTFRLGQLICALANKAESTEPGNVYDLEDDELVAGAEEWLAWLRDNP